jgi:hypothetical protein
MLTDVKRITSIRGIDMPTAPYQLRSIAERYFILQQIAIYGIIAA